MSKYDKDTKFYWLQLKEDFFENDAIEWLEEQKPNGRDYAYFYLKLCLKSLKTNGILIRKVGNILIPYDNQKLAELTRIDFDTVTVAMELLKKIGLITILESGEIYVNQLENLIGSKSVGAFKKQQQRTLENKGVEQVGGQMSATCPPKCPPKIEIELDINNIYGQTDLTESENDSVKDEEEKQGDKSALTEDFEKQWEIYPRKQGKKDAFRHYKTLLKGKDCAGKKIVLNNKQIWNAICNYIDYIEKNKIDKQYIMHGDRFFNSGIFDYIDEDLE